MQKWGIFNASLLHNEHGHPPFLFQYLSFHMINIERTKFEQKSIVTFISEVWDFASNKLYEFEKYLFTYLFFICIFVLI